MSATYKIGEAAALLNLKTYVLRFWETEFPQIEPLRTEKGQRLYTEEHLALLDRIRFLLHERGLTIEGARRVLMEEATRGVSYTRAHGMLQTQPGTLLRHTANASSISADQGTMPSLTTTEDTPGFLYTNDAERQTALLAGIVPPPIGQGIHFETMAPPAHKTGETVHETACGMKQQNVLLMPSSIEPYSEELACAEDEDALMADELPDADEDMSLAETPRASSAAVLTALSDIITELEAVAELLRGPSAGKPT